MGGRGRGHKRKGDKRVLKRDFKKSRDNVWDEKKSPKPEADGSYKPYEKKNEAFDKYYKAQKIVPDAEWDAFLESLRTPLPTSFRINGSGKFAEDIRDQIENKLFSKVDAAAGEMSEETVRPPSACGGTPTAWRGSSTTPGSSCAACRTSSRSTSLSSERTSTGPSRARRWCP